MIKIIKPGTIQKATCKECGCIFQFENEDILERPEIPGDVPMVMRRLYKYVNCPQCNEEYKISATR